MPPRKPSKSSTSAPRPLDAQLDGLSDVKFSAIFKSALAASSSGRVAPVSQPASPSKRKMSPMDESSAPSTPSPKKKQVISATPGSAVIRAMASLTAEDLPTPLGRSTRARVPTAKAAAALAEQSIVALGPKASSLTRVNIKQEPFNADASRLKIKTQAKGRALASSPISLSSDDEDDLPSVAKLSRSLFVDKEAIDDVDVDKISVSPPYEGTYSSGYLVDGFVVPDTADTDVDEEAHSDASNAARKNASLGGRRPRLPYTPSPPVTPSRRAKKMVLPDDPVDEKEQTLISHKLASINPANDSSRVPADENDYGIEVDVVALPVMDVELQDPLMEGAYAHLPLIKKRAFIEPYGYDKNLGSEPRPTIRISVLRKYMSTENLESLFRALLFDKHAFYVNLARADPSVLASSYRRITLKNGGAYATCLMNGVVPTCDLAGPGVLAGSGNLDSEKYRQHRISIFPFQQEIVRDIGAIFQILQLPATGVKGTYSKGGFAFVTRGEGKRAAQSYAGGYAVPKEKPRPDLSAHSDLFAVDAVPTATSFAGSNATKTVLEYDDIIPIYDGRSETGRPFRFDPQDFKDLPTWRAYMNDRSDLPPLSVVTVGYSANWFTLDRTNPSAQKYLSTNVLFVVVLNTPSSLITGGGGSASAGEGVSGKGKARA
ncbi:hypothetical protein FPV67DRAFT_1784356 [Lyophyllum atratum]|nr:hypothetical protein FPV67DRAFT_1784356 [Lyophyllum atratum]